MQIRIKAINFKILYKKFCIFIHGCQKRNLGSGSCVDPDLKPCSRQHISSDMGGQKKKKPIVGNFYGKQYTARR